VLLITFLTLVAVLGVGILYLVRPVSLPALAKQKPERFPFERALTLAGAEQANPPPEINPVSYEKVYSQGHRTQQAFVLLHGLSNSPAQFAGLGEILFERGHNVFIPRLPYHGENDRLTKNFGKLTLEQIATWASRAVEIGRGLGDEVIVAGLSVNGVTAAWIAQDVPNVKRCVVLSPFFGPPGLPDWIRGPLARSVHRLPNADIWWDSELKENNPGPTYAYPRFSTRVVSNFMLLGEMVLNEAATAAPQCKEIVVVSSNADEAIDLNLVRKYVNDLQKWPSLEVTDIVFPSEDKVIHDFIDPYQPGEQIERLYPIVISLLEGDGYPSGADDES